MMQCPQCGTENRLGALFCRSCGAKLQIDEVTTETFEQATGIVPKDKLDAKKRVRKIIFNSLRLVFLALIVLGFYLALQRPDVDEPDTSGKLAKQFMERRAELVKAIEQDRELTREFTHEEINSDLASMMVETKKKEKEKKKKGGTFQLLDTWLLFEGDGNVNWVIDAKLLGRPLRFQYRGTIEIKDGSVTFTPKGLFGATLGKLPYPSALMKMTTSRLWKSISEAQDVKNEKVLKAISELEFSGDTVTVTVKP